MLMQYCNKMSDKNKNTVNKLSGLLTGCSTCLVILHTHLFSGERERSPGYCLEMIHNTTKTLVFHITIVQLISI